MAATVALARENGLRAEEPAVLADLFSLMMHLRPAPVVAHHRPDLEIVGLDSSVRGLRWWSSWWRFSLPGSMEPNGKTR